MINQNFQNLQIKYELNLFQKSTKEVPTQMQVIPKKTPTPYFTI